jgi:hypothetical protein
MKLYKGENAHFEYLSDRGVYASGCKGELDFEIRVWNFIAKLINYLWKNRN